MRYVLLVQLAFSILSQTCLGWIASTTLPQKRSMAKVPRTMAKIRPDYTTDKTLRLFNTQHESAPAPDKAQDGPRIRKPWHRHGSRLKFGLDKKTTKRSVVSLALMAMIPFLTPSVANAALSSTSLSATAAASTMMRPTSPGSPTTWQTWLLFAGLWLWQSAQQSNLVPLLSQGLRLSLDWYMIQLTANPVVTKSLTAGVIGVLGDCMAQVLEHVMHQRQHKQGDGHKHASKSVSSLEYDSRRGVSALLDSVFLSGPLMHYGYEFFDHILPIADGGSGAALLHVLADSIFLDAIFVASTFIVTGRMEGYSFRQLLPQLRRDYVPTLKASWVTSLFLMPIEFVCFRFLPLSYRVLAVNFIDVIWDTVVSFMAHRGRQEQPTAVEDRNSDTVTTPMAQAAVQ